MMILTEDGIICARDSWGRTPLIIGKKEGAYAASSETTSFPNLDFETAHEVGPGEIVKITADGMEQIRPANKKMQVCSFLWVYYGFPTSTYEGKNVEEARFSNGFNLAKTDDVEVDCCSGIPDSGTGMAMGYAAGKGVPYQRCIAKYTPTWPRSFTPSNQSMRSLVAKMKLIPNKAMLKGKRVLFCDDSIVRGTQLRDNVKVLFDQAGLKECHMRIACPPLVYGCPFINFTSSKSDMELITRRIIEMNFLPDVYVPCEVCHGKRYNRETLEVRYKGKSIADVLDMTINQAVEFFENVPQILNKIKALQSVGLGYIKLGQSSTTLSGGESQRVKLATELSKRDTGKTLYILDEPTTGLHFEDIRILMDVLQKLVDRGNTVIIIEHNLDVIKLADWLIDMGPEGGRGGGQLLFAGTPEEMAKSKIGYTYKFLAPLLKKK